MSAFLVMLREGVEAAIIVAILLAYLNRIGRRSESRWVWAGTVAAILVSLVAGVVLWNTVGGLEGDAEELVEGVIALVAAGLLTWMIFWMGQQAQNLKGHIHSQVDTAIAAGGATALATIAFVAVVREGIEASLFLISTTVGAEASSTQIVGGLLGLTAALAIGVLFYAGSSRIDLRAFFRLTGVLIILFAAGLVSKGIHEFQELGLLPTLSEHVWDLRILDPSAGTAGRFLGSLFGWTPRPSLLMAIAYTMYLVPVLTIFLRMTASEADPPDSRRKRDAPDITVRSA
ncbi:MAG: iron uptake transporter permease EfeU [Actinomycetota bacterium]|nr:iron uptake transporter permease EfeU [Actinomycetota bacterium]